MTKATSHKMDKKIEKKPRSLGKSALAIIMLMAAISVYFLSSSPSISEKNLRPVMVETISVNEVIPLNAELIPESTRVLDVVVGGVVESVDKNNGDIVQKGDIIVTLSNPSLLLEVTRNEALVTEQINNHRLNTLQLTKDKSFHELLLMEKNYELSEVKSKLEHDKALLEKGFINRYEFQQLELKYAHLKAHLAKTERSQSNSISVQEESLAVAEQSIVRMKNNLVASQENLENLTVRAPVDGMISNYNLRVGESISTGQRIGQIDSKKFRLKSFIDEYYISKLSLGQTGNVIINGKVISTVLADISPTVTKNRIEVFFDFEQGADLKMISGQKVKLELLTGKTDEFMVFRNDIDAPPNSTIKVFPEANLESVGISLALGKLHGRFIEIESKVSNGDKFYVVSP